jgi:mitochondrial fission protein ELM1
MSLLGLQYGHIDTPCMTLLAHPTLTLWRLTDGKPGHEKQSLGLARALQRLTGAVSHDLAVHPRRGAWLAWLLGRFPEGDGLPAPDLILAAGHATHVPALAARRARGGRIIVLMRPSLPLALFDLCLIPQHDRPPARDNVIATRGVLNAVTPTGQNDPNRGLLLIGGPSAHYDWDDRAVAGQVMDIVRATPEVAWQLTTSRRTPPSFLVTMPSELPANLSVMPHTATPPGWLEQALCASGQAWVSEDSVSMLYEALTAGCAVGLLQLPGRGVSRVAQGIQTLIAEHWVTPYAAWLKSKALTRPAGRFDEAERCARLILETLFAIPDAAGSAA